MITDGVWERLVTIPAVREERSSYKDAPALWVDGREIAHLEGDDRLDLRLTRGEIRTRRAALRADARVRLRPSTSADWLEVRVLVPDDIDYLLHLVEAAVDANRAAKPS